MKKLIIYLVSFSLLLGALLYIILKKESKPSHVITINQAYSLTDDQYLNINLYFNKKKHILTEEKAIYSFNLTNNVNLKVSLQLESLEFIKEEYYLNEKYYVYKYQFLLPSVEEKLLIEPANLEIILENSINYRLEIGKISILPIIENNRYTWLSLEGKRLDTNIYPRIGVILIKFDKLENNISYIDDGFNINNSFYPDFENKTLAIYINNENYILAALPLNIHYTNEEVLQIPFFNYMILNNALEQSGPLINIYYD